MTGSAEEGERAGTTLEFGAQSGLDQEVGLLLGLQGTSVGPEARKE